MPLDCAGRSDYKAGVFAVPRLTPGVKRLLISLFGAFVVELILENFVGFPVFALLSLNLTGLNVASLWQVFTYAWVQPPGPGSVLSILIGLLFLWWILAPFEERYGSKRLYQVFAVGVISGSLPPLLLSLISGPYPPLFGFNYALGGGIAAFAYSLRGRGRLSLFGIVEMKPMTLVYVVIGFDVLYFIASGNVAALVAGLGAIGGCISFVRWITRPRGGRKRPSKRRPFQVISGGEDERPKWLN